MKPAVDNPVLRGHRPSHDLHSPAAAAADNTRLRRRYDACPPTDYADLRRGREATIGENRPSIVVGRQL